MKLAEAYFKMTDVWQPLTSYYCTYAKSKCLAFSSSAASTKKTYADYINSVGQSQECVQPDHHKCGEDCSDEHVEHLLSVSESPKVMAGTIDDMK